MLIRIICSICLAIWYTHFCVKKKRDIDKSDFKVLSISLIITYIIFLVLIWIVV